MRIEGHIYTHCECCHREYYIPTSRPVVACNDCWEDVKEEIAEEAARQAADSSRNYADQQRAFRTLGGYMDSDS